MKYGEYTSMVKRQANTPAVPSPASKVISAFISQTDTRSAASRKLYERELRAFFAWITATGRQLEALTRADIIAYREDLLNGNAAAGITRKAPYTVAAYLTVVRMFYTWTEASGLYNNIAQGVKSPRRDSRFHRDYLREDQAAALMAETLETGSLRDIAIMQLMIGAGLRTVEIVRADVCDLITLPGQHFALDVLGKGKQVKTRIPIPDECGFSIREYLSTRTDLQKDSPMFASLNHSSRGERLSTRAISAIARKHLDSVGLEKGTYTAHSLRHTCACLMLENGADPTDVQGQLRHASIDTTQMYTYHVEEHARLEKAAVRVLDRILKNPNTK